MIDSARQSGSSVSFHTSDHTTRSISLSSGESLHAYTSSHIIVKTSKGDYKIYDEKGRLVKTSKTPSA